VRRRGRRKKEEEEGEERRTHKGLDRRQLAGLAVLQAHLEDDVAGALNGSDLLRDVELSEARLGGAHVDDAALLLDVRAPLEDVAQRRELRGGDVVSGRRVIQVDEVVEEAAQDVETALGQLRRLGDPGEDGVGG